VPIVAGRAAFARVFCTSGNASPIPQPVRIEATVTAGGRSWPAVRHVRDVSVPAPQVRAMPSGSANRNLTDDSVNMQLGIVPEGLLRVDVVATAGGMTARGSTSTVVVRGPSVRIVPVLASMAWPGTRIAAPSAAVVSQILDKVVNLSPWTDVSIEPFERRSWTSLWPVDWWGGGEGMLASFITAFPPRRLDFMRDLHLVFAGTVPVPSMRGRIAVPRSLNPTGVAIIWIANEGRAVETACHEIGHVLGLNHVDDGRAGAPFSAHLPVLGDQPFYDPNEGRVLPEVAETMTYQDETRPSIMHREFVRRGHH